MLVNNTATINIERRWRQIRSIVPINSNSDYELAYDIYTNSDSIVDKCLAICLYCHHDKNTFDQCANNRCQQLENVFFPKHFDKDCLFYRTVIMS
ncbi:unnamed protein product [Trichobilharzia szidati]|nr:unnamed protein product [Trichobilharzia szidati]